MHVCASVLICSWMSGSSVYGAFENLKVGAAWSVSSAWRWWIHWLSHMKTGLTVTGWSASIVLILIGYERTSWRLSPIVRGHRVFTVVCHLMKCLSKLVDRNILDRAKMITTFTMEDDSHLPRWDISILTSTFLSEHFHCLVLEFLPWISVIIHPGGSENVLLHLAQCLAF